MRAQSQPQAQQPQQPQAQQPQAPQQPQPQLQQPVRYRVHHSYIWLGSAQMLLALLAALLAPLRTALVRLPTRRPGSW